MFQLFLVRRPGTATNLNEEREMDFDDLRDYLDQDIPAKHFGQFPIAESGPIAQFLADMPDWMNMTPEDPNKALESLLVP